MTRTEAAANFANVYRANAIAKGRTYDIEVATAYATQDILNMVRHMSEEDAVSLINDDAAFMMEAA